MFPNCKKICSPNCTHIDFIFFGFIATFSFLIVLQTGFTGFGPDQGMMFSAGWKFASGFYPLIDMPQAQGSTVTALTGLAFKLFGTSWRTYVGVAAATNVVFAGLAYALLRHLGLPRLYALAYCLATAIVFAPPHSVPNYDQTSFLCSFLMIACLLVGRHRQGFAAAAFHGLAVLMGALAFFSKQIPLAYFAPLVVFLLAVIPAAQRMAALIGVAVGVLGVVAVLAILLNYSHFSLHEWVYYWVSMPLLMGKERSTQFEPRAFFNLFNLSSLTFIAATFIALWVLWRQKRAIIKAPGDDTAVALISGLWFFALTFLFVRTAHNVIDQGIPMVFVATGLIHIAVVRMLPEKRARIVGSVLMALCVIDGVHFHLTSNLQRKVHGPFDFSQGQDLRIAETIPALAGLRWIEPFAHNISVDDILERYAFLSGVSKHALELDYLGYGSSPAVVAAQTLDRVPSLYVQPGHATPVPSTPEGQDFFRHFYDVLAQNQLEWIISRGFPDDPGQVFSQPVIEHLQCERRVFPHFIAVRLCPGKMKEELDWILKYHARAADRG